MTKAQFQQISNGTFWLGDCFEVMAQAPDASVDLILCDLPYGTTACKWDTVLPLEQLWAEYWRIAKPNAAIVLTCTMPFTAALVMSQIAHFKYCLIWDKVNLYTGALQSNKRPMRRHEEIAIFAKKQTVYNKQYREGKPYNVKRTGGHGEYHNNVDAEVVRTGINDGTKHNPCSIIEIKGDVKKEKGLHPTQKPVELFEYLIKTYSNEGDLVLDNCAGSGTTAIACENTNRRWVCIEKEIEYADKAIERIKASVA